MRLDRARGRGYVAGVRIEPYERRKHGDGPARVVEDVYREYGFTWEPEGYHLDVLSPETAYAAPDGFFDVAVEGGRVIGTIGGSRHGEEAELKRLYLVRAERGKGVGKALAQRFVAWAKGIGCRRAVLWSDKRFQEAHALYERLGFRTFGERVCDDPDLSPEWGYVLEPL